MSSRKVRNPFLLLACILLLGVIGCATNPPSRARQFSSYQFDPGSLLESRVVAAPDFILDYLNNNDNVDFYKAYLPTDQEKSLVQQYLSALPKSRRTILQSRLLGIYFVRDFMGGGLTEFVFDGARNLHAFIVVNSATLSTPMSDWLTFRDQSCFKPDGSDTRLSSDCGTSYVAFMYALLHESSHVVDAVLHSHPDPNPADEKAFPFVTEFWKGFSRPLPQFDFSHRKDLFFYGLNGGPRLALNDAPQTYRALSQSPFASLYGSTSVLEDFAELFTWAYYTQVLHQHYSTTVIQGGKPILTYVPMDNPQVRQRALALVKLYD